MILWSYVDVCLIIITLECVRVMSDLLNNSVERSGLEMAVEDEGKVYEKQISLNNFRVVGV